MRLIGRYSALTFLGYASLSTLVCFGQSAVQQTSRQPEQAQAANPSESRSSVDSERLDELSREVRQLKAQVEQLQKLLAERDQTATAQGSETRAEGTERTLFHEDADLAAQPDRAKDQTAKAEQSVNQRQARSLLSQSEELKTRAGFEVPESAHNFVVTGYGSGFYNLNPSGNTFGGSFNPIFLYSVRPHLLFEGEVEMKLGRNPNTGESEADIGLEYGQVDWMVHKYATVVFGKYLNPFGDFIEHRHPSWINKLVSFPLPLREGDEGGLLIFSDLGLQVRGAIPLDSQGRSLGYAVFTGNGPAFDSEKIGAGMAENFVDINGNKAVGGRINLRPLPFASQLGQLELGYSTWNGKWDVGAHHQFRAHGADFVYQKGALDIHGEYVHTGRQTAFGPDTRSGWYAETGYKLNRFKSPWLSHVEPVYRISFQDQAGSHQRQHAIGIDYWITHSVVWKLEYDRQRLDVGPFKNLFLTQLAFGF